MTDSAVATPLEAEPSEAEQFLSFQLPSGILAMVPTLHLVEILKLNLSQIVPIPDTLPSMLGVCNWRGEVLWLADLGHLLGVEPLYAHDLRTGQVPIIVVHHEGQMLGLGVAQVHQMLWCDRAQMQPTSALTETTPDDTVTLMMTQCVRGTWSDSTDQQWMILDAKALIAGLS